MFNQHLKMSLTKVVGVLWNEFRQAPRKIPKKKYGWKNSKKPVVEGVC